MRRFLVVLVVVLIVAVGLVVGGWLLARPDQPAAFYTSARAEGAPGALLAVEPYDFDVPDGAKGWRIIYVTTRIDGSPAVASAVVMVSEAATGPLLPVTWAHGTNGTAPGCAPSVVGPLKNVPAVAELLAEGWVYLAPDYVGLGTEGGHAYLVGEDAARAVLDAVRAAAQMTEVEILPRTVVWGHSQGGHAALWTGMLARTYAPDVEVLGIAAQAPATNLPALVEGAQDGLFGKIVSSFLLHAFAETYDDVRVADYVSGYRAPLLQDIAARCAVDARVMYSVAELALMPGDLFSTMPEGMPLGARLVENIPVGPFEMPVFIAQGIEDEIVLEPIQTAFVAGLCDAGVNLTYRRYEGLQHVSLVAPDSVLTVELIAWTRARFAGEASEADCG
ncbi:lipase family protein [Devosia sp.]|uniref:lipase family protein n=1 Tax=Devosia sp. TaxID=1871048 RepID=UPI001B13130C|nr:lipase family protein [Devosia sp.]MBO9587827.1 alpha/beta fold hydrolase [Devosia sp.]